MSMAKKTALVMDMANGKFLIFSLKFHNKFIFLNICNCLLCSNLGTLRLIETQKDAVLFLVNFSRILINEKIAVFFFKELITNITITQKNKDDQNNYANLFSN